MSTIGLYQELKQKLDNWGSKYMPEGCEFIINIEDLVIENGQSFEMGTYRIKVIVRYSSPKGVATFFNMCHTMPLYAVSMVTCKNIENTILKELDNVLKNGKLDKVKDGTFNGWNT